VIRHTRALPAIGIAAAIASPGPRRYRALARAERVCLVGPSLKATPHLTMTIDVDAPQPAAELSEAA
jgi:hypothetical protein